MQNDKKIFVDYDSPIKMVDKMHISLRIPNELGFVNDTMALFNRNGELPGSEAKCYLTYDEKKSNDDYSVFSGSISFGTPGYRTFFIKLKLNGNWEKLELDKETGDVVIAEKQKNLAFWEVFVYYSYFKTPDYIKGGIMYQIFVDTFCSENLSDEMKKKVVSWDTFPKWQSDSDGTYRNNQFYGGNLRGIIKKVEEGYFSKLNITVIYLTPIFKSPSSNRYDIEDYMEVDEMVGTWEELDELHKKLNNLGIALILDVVFNHSSSQNRLLQEDPEMYSWKEKYTIPNCWWGYSHLVEFNKISENYFNNLKKWLNLYSMYADGIRIDVADNLPDYVLKFIRNNFEKYILLEVWKNAVTGDFREFLYGDEADGVMNYRFGNAIGRYVRWGNCKNFKEIVEEIYQLYPSEALAVSPIFLSSHDIPRIPNILVGDFMQEDPSFENIWDMEKNSYWYNGETFDTHRFRKWEVENDYFSEETKNLIYELLGIALFLQYTLPGLPSIFAGDEAGVTGYKDPTNRKPFPWDNIGKRIFELYCKFGEFRMNYRSNFVNVDFEIIETDVIKTIYRTGNLICIINRTSEAIRIDGYNLKRCTFSLKEIEDEHVMPPYNAIVIES